jgi:hypothetical protein
VRTASGSGNEKRNTNQEQRSPAAEEGDEPEEQCLEEVLQAEERLVERSLKAHLLRLRLVHCTHRHRGLGQAPNTAAGGWLGPAQESDRLFEGFFFFGSTGTGRKTAGATGDNEGRPALVF